MFDSGSNLVAIMIVVVIVPVALVAPTMAVFIPPTVRMFPTVGTRFGKFVAPMFCLRTLPRACGPHEQCAFGSRRQRAQQEPRGTKQRQKPGRGDSRKVLAI